MSVNHGNSARAIVNLATTKGYSLVCTTNCNLIFVDSELAHYVLEDLPSLEELNKKGEDATYIFPGYDGTILSNKTHFTVRWHGIRAPMDKVQFLPKFLRRYYGDYGRFQGLFFLLLVSLRARNHLPATIKRYKAEIFNRK